MKASILAEEILLLMTYGFEMLALPSFRKWDQSYEGWLHANGFLRRLQWLEAQKWVERQGKKNNWVYRLTEKGRRACHDRHNPEAFWERKWDGWWRQLIFDLPVSQKKARARLLRWLRRNRFGYLQDSVWITPDPVGELSEAVRQFRDDAESFTLLECRCVGGFTADSLVKAAWRFDLLRERYERYARFARGTIKRTERERLHPRELFQLMRAERQLWTAVCSLDPLLPRALWPAGYQGEEAWECRRKLLRSFGHQCGRG